MKTSLMTTIQGLRADVQLINTRLGNIDPMGAADILVLRDNLKALDETYRRMMVTLEATMDRVTVIEDSKAAELVTEGVDEMDLQGPQVLEGTQLEKEATA